MPPLLAGGLLVVVFGDFEIAGSTLRLAHICVVSIPYLAIFLVAKQVAAYRRVLRIAAPVSLGTAEHAIIGVVGMCRASTRTRADDGREHQKALGVFHHGHRSLGVSAEVLVFGARGGDTGCSFFCELVNLVVSVTVFNLTALAKGIAINHATDVGIVVEIKVALSQTTRFVTSSSTPGRFSAFVHIAENNAATRNGTDVATNGNKMRLVTTARDGKSRCRVFGRRPINDHAIDNVIATKDAADNATEKRRRNAVGILGRISNSRRRVHIANIQIAHHAAVTIGNKAAKRTLVILYLDGCVFIITAKVANDDAPKRVGPISKTAKRCAVESNRIALSRLDAVIRALHIAVHGFVAQRLRGIGRRVSGLLLPFIIGTVRLLVDVRNLIVGRVIAAAASAEPTLVGDNGDLPAVKRRHVINVVGNGIHLRRVCDGIRIAVGTTSHYQLWNALVDFNFVILDAILGGFSLVNIRKVVTEPRPDVTVLLTINRHIAAHGTIRRFVVIPELLARVLRTPINLGSVGHLARIAIGLSKGVVRRARARASVAKTLQQARMGEDRIVLLAGQADLLKLRRHLIGLTAYTKLSEQRRSRLGATRVPSSLDILRVQAHVLLHLVDEQRHIGVSVRGAVGAVDNQIVECKIIN